jgi:Ser/Thr protein kinase RdoA (MazF antagonist)
MAHENVLNEGCVNLGPLVEVYSEYFGYNNATFSRVDHDNTMIAIVYRVDFSSEKSLILKICTRDQDFYRECYFLNALAGLIPVPKLEKVAKPEEGRAGAILMEYLRGCLLTEEDWTRELAHDVGAKLAILHSQRSAVYGDCTHDTSHTQNAREYFQKKFFEELKECIHHLPEKTIKHCQEYYESHQNLLDFVDGPCMIHRDFRPGNIVVKNKKLVGVIDWASGCFGFAEQDFCSLEHRNWPKNSEYKKALLAGYASIRPLPDYRAIMSLLRLGRALAVIGFTVKDGTWRGKDEKIYRYNQHFLDSFLKTPGSSHFF